MGKCSSPAGIYNPEGEGYLTPSGGGRSWTMQKANQLSFGEFDPGSGRTLAACLIHASRADQIGACSGLVSGGRVSNTWATCPQDRDNSGKPELIPDNTEDRMVFG